MGARQPPRARAQCAERAGKGRKRQTCLFDRLSFRPLENANASLQAFLVLARRDSNLEHTKRFVCRRNSRAVAPQPEHPVPMRDFRARNGERRTRTADTTIFSRYVLAAERREIPGNARFLRVDLAPVIFAICAGFHAFQGMAGLPSPFWPRGLLRR